MDLHPIYYFIAALAVIVGLAGTVVPAIPGAILIFAGLFFAAQTDGFAHVGWVGLTIIGVLGALTFVADFVGSVLGAKRVGASKLALAGATVGGIAGFFFGLVGMILGPFVGAAAGELLATGGVLRAGKVGVGTWLGLVAAAVAKVFLAFMMLATFAVAWLT